jgi:hypothetical protein
MTDHHTVNDAIEDRIEETDDQPLTEFLHAIITHERDNLHLSQPEYKQVYRKEATRITADNQTADTTNP